MHTKEFERATEVAAALAALERICFGELSDDQIESILSLAAAHREFMGKAERLYDRGGIECTNKGFEVDYDASSFDATQVTVHSAETLPKSSTPRYEFEASYHLYGDGSGGRWVCKRSEAWEEHP